MNTCTWWIGYSKLTLGFNMGVLCVCERFVLALWWAGDWERPQVESRKRWSSWEHFALLGGVLHLWAQSFSLCPLDQTSVPSLVTACTETAEWVWTRSGQGATFWSMRRINEGKSKELEIQSLQEQMHTHKCLIHTHTSIIYFNFSLILTALMQLLCSRANYCE